MSFSSIKILVVFILELFRQISHERSRSSTLRNDYTFDTNNIYTNICVICLYQTKFHLKDNFECDLKAFNTPMSVYIYVYLYFIMIFNKENLKEKYMFLFLFDC